jgi:cellulose synthase/poly-beta-1,6-N-acetylglucosamine synthase-like glycosyltransferase
MNWGLLLFSLFIAVTLIQIIYYITVFRPVVLYTPKPKDQSQTHPVSVVICARDEDENLARNLPGVLVQHYPTTHEVIVVNDNSLDDSKYILAELQKTFKQLQIVALEQEMKWLPGKKFPLSIGIKESKHEIVLLTDADCTPASEHWIAKMQEAFTPGIEVVLGYGAYHKLPGLLNKIIRWETFHTAMQYFGFALSGMPYMGVGRNLSYRKELFFRNKGFSSINHLPSGDDDLFINKVAHKANTAVVLDPESFTLSLPKTSWKDWVRQKKRHLTTGKYYKRSHKFLLGLYSASQFLFYLLFILSLLFFDWRWSLIPFAIGMLVKAVVLRKAMQKLGEADLWKWFPLLDVWMCVYYIIFAPALWRKPGKSWK